MLDARGQGERPEAVTRALRFLEHPDPGDFEKVALAVFRFQARENEPYRRFCERRGRTPEAVVRWEDVPPVPTAAFRGTVLSCAPATRVFRTSGTTAGPAARGEHHLPELALYRASWSEPFRRHLLPDRAHMRILSLVPGEDVLPDSSLSFMVTRIVERFGVPGSGFFLDRDGMDTAGLVRALDRAQSEGEPVLLVTTAFGGVAFLDMLRARGRRFHLPAGSRIMDTGGFKGRTREISREDLVALYEERLGIPASHVVGEYGMTEMSSQFYEATLSRAIAGEEPRRVFEAPPWVRTRVLDPDTLEPVPEGRPGLLAHFDLANAWTVCAVVTEDLGVATPGGFRLLGRARGAELRGCSLATEELLGG